MSSSVSLGADSVRGDSESVHKTLHTFFVAVKTLHSVNTVNQAL